MSRNSGSNAPVSQVGAPPLRSESPSHVSLPGCPASGTVQKRQRLSPVSASYASMKPRTQNSPLAMPVTTILSIARGAPVMLYPFEALGHRYVPHDPARGRVQSDEMSV